MVYQPFTGLGKSKFRKAFHEMPPSGFENLKYPPKVVSISVMSTKKFVSESEMLP